MTPRELLQHAAVTYAALREHPLPELRRFAIDFLSVAADGVTYEIDRKPVNGEPSKTKAMAAFDPRADERALWVREFRVRAATVRECGFVDEAMTYERAAEMLETNVRPSDPAKGGGT